MSTNQSAVTIAGIVFDRVRYDADADALYLHVGEPDSAVDFDESPEGHHLRFDDAGHLVGITMVGVRADLAAHRPLAVTIPERVEIDPASLPDLLGAA
jgi:uncharacterized protein YuzE